MNPPISLKNRLSAEAVQVLDSFQHTVIVVDLQGVITFWNEGARSMLGWSLDEAVGEAGIELIVPASHQEEAYRILGDLAQGISWKGDFPIQRRDESTFWGEVLASPVFSESGEVIMVAASILNAAARREVEEQVRRLDSHRRLAAEVSGVFTFEQDMLTGEIRFADQVSSITGIDLRNSDDREAYYCHIHPDDRQYVREQVANALKPDGPGEYDMEYRYIRADGETRWFASRGKTRFEGVGPERHATLLTGMITDVTRRRLIQQDLANKEERLRLAVDAADSFTYERDLRTGAIKFDDNVFKLTGFPVGARPYYETFYSRIDPEAAARMQAEADRIANLSYPANFHVEYQFKKFDGELRWFETKANTYFDDDSGRPTRILGLVTDVTDKKRAEEAQRFLSESSRVLASSLDYDEVLQRVVNIAVPSFADMASVYVVRADGELEVVAQAHRDPEMLPLVRQSTQDFSIPETHVLKRVMRSGEPTLIQDIRDPDFDVLFRSPEHRALVRRLQQSSLIVAPLTAHGNVLGVLTVSTCGPERRRYDSADLAVASELGRRCGSAVDNARLYTMLVESERRLSLTLQVSKVGFYELGYPADGEALVSEQWAQIFGYELDELPPPGQIESWFYSRVHPDDMSALIGAARDAADRDIPSFSVELRVKHRDERWVWVRLVNYVSERVNSGRGVRGSGVMLDISDLKEAERTLLDYNHELETRVTERTAELESLTRRLRAMASELTGTEQRERRRLAKLLHDDLQQLLVAARMQASSIQDDESRPQTGRARDLTVSLLDQAIAGSRTLTAQLRPTALYESGLASALQWLTTWMERSNGLRVSLEIDESLDPIVDSDASLLFDSARELLLNVVKHAETDTVTVSLQKGSEDFVSLMVSDRGKGIDLKRLESSEPERSGLGLFSMRERISLSGGRLSIVSESGRGSSIEILWPVGNKAPPLEEGYYRTERGQVSQVDSGLAERPITVLLVDDHSLVRQSLSTIIDGQPDISVVAEAASAEDAIEAYERLMSDVVVMDVNLPGLNGIRACEAIKSNHPGAVLIGLSVQNDQATMQAMIDAGASAYVSKDEEIELLLETIRSRGGGRGALRA